ncbi:hypothetical protein ABPG77_000113 [Micractinium sp. CCAP 211/92]
MWVRKGSDRPVSPQQGQAASLPAAPAQQGGSCEQGSCKLNFGRKGVCDRIPTISLQRPWPPRRANQVSRPNGSLKAMEVDAAAVAPVQEQEPMEVETAKEEAAAPAEVPAAKLAGEAGNEDNAAESGAGEAAKDGKGKGQQAGEEATPAAKKGRAAKPKPTPATAEGTGTGGRARRERKQVERFVPTVTPKEEEPQALPEGKGSKLRDIPNVAFKMGKLTGRDELLEGLHLVLFRRKGTAQQRKKGILDFNGFAFPADQQDKEMESRRASLGKWKLELVHKLMDTLDLPRGSGDKAAKVERVLEFLTEPKATSDVDLAAKEAEKKAKDKAKKERAAAKKDKEKAKQDKAGKRKSAGNASKGRLAKKAKKEDGVEESEPEEEEEPASEPEEESEEEEGSDFEAELPGGTKKAAAHSGGARRRSKAGSEEADGEPEEEDGGEQPAGDEASKLSGSQVTEEVEALLSAMPPADLPTVSIKTILARLEEKHGFSFKSRKAEVKAVAQDYVLKYVEEHPEVQQEAEEGGAAAEAAEAAPGGEATGEAAGEADATTANAAGEAEAVAEAQEEAPAAVEGAEPENEGAAAPGGGEGQEEGDAPAEAAEAAEAAPANAE